MGKQLREPHRSSQRRTSWLFSCSWSFILSTGAVNFNYDQALNNGRKIHGIVIFDDGPGMASLQPLSIAIQSSFFKLYFEYSPQRFSFSCPILWSYVLVAMPLNPSGRLFFLDSSYWLWRFALLYKALGESEWGTVRCVVVNRWV